MNVRRKPGRTYVDLRDLESTITKTFREWLDSGFNSPLLLREAWVIRVCTLAPALYGGPAFFSPLPKRELVQCILSCEGLKSDVVPDFSYCGTYFASKAIANLDILVLASVHVLSLVASCVVIKGELIPDLCRAIAHWPTIDDHHSNISLRPECACVVLREIVKLMKIEISASTEELFTAAVHGFHHFANFIKAQAAYGNAYREELIFLIPRSVGVDAATYCESANKAYKAGRFKEAVDLYSKAIQLEPLCGRPYSNRAQAHMRMQKHKRALADAHRAYALDPLNGKNCWRLAQVLYESGYLLRAFSINSIYGVFYCKPVECAEFEEQRLRIVGDRHAWDKFMKIVQSSPVYLWHEFRMACGLAAAEQNLLFLTREALIVVRAYYGPEAEMKLRAALPTGIFAGSSWLQSPSGSENGLVSLKTQPTAGTAAHRFAQAHAALIATISGSADSIHGTSTPAVAPSVGVGSARSGEASAAVERQKLAAFANGGLGTTTVPAAAADAATSGTGGCAESGSVKDSPAPSEITAKGGGIRPLLHAVLGSSLSTSFTSQLEVVEASSVEPVHKGCSSGDGQVKNGCTMKKALRDKKVELNKEPHSQPVMHGCGPDGALSDHAVTISRLSARLVELSSSLDAEKQRRSDAEAAMAGHKKASQLLSKRVAALTAELAEQKAESAASKTTVAEQQSIIAQLRDDVKRTEALLQMAKASETGLKAEIGELKQRFQAEASVLEQQCHEHCLRARQAEAKIIEDRYFNTMLQMMNVIKHCHARCSGNSLTSAVRGLLNAYADRVSQRLRDVQAQCERQIQLVLKSGRLLSSLPPIDFSLPPASQDEAMVLVAILPSIDGALASSLAVPSKQSQGAVGGAAIELPTSIQQAPLVQSQQEEEGPEPCVICYEDLDGKQATTQLDCEHTYHTKCIKNWLSKPPATCPMCRCHVQQPVGPSTSSSSR